MSKYIDVDKIKYHPIVSDGTYSYGIHNVSGIFDVDLFVSKEEIDAIPEADVEQVVHAHWEKECRSQITFPSGEVAMLIERKCSNCHRWSDKEILDYYPKPAKRCSECGAKMNGKEDTQNV